MFVEGSAEPITKPAEPTTKPGTKPDRPSPIRRDRPSENPDPKAKKKILKKAKAEEVSNRFIKLAKKEGIDLKKYFNKI